MAKRVCAAEHYMTVKEVMAGRLRTLRAKARMTQKQVAQILNLDRSAYAYYETATTFPDYQTLVRLAKMYRVTADYLLGLEDGTEAGGAVRPRAQREALAQADSAQPLIAATPEERRCLLTFRAMTPEGREELLSAAQRILSPQMK